MGIGLSRDLLAYQFGRTYTITENEMHQDDARDNRGQRYADDTCPC